MNHVTVIGNATKDFETFATGSGGTLGKVSIAENRKWTDGAGNEREETSYYDVVVANSEEAEQYATWITRGMRLMVDGRLRQSSYETSDGDKRSKFEIVNAEIGASGRYATITVERAERPSGGGGQQRQGAATGRRQPAGTARRAPARANAAATSDY